MYFFFGSAPINIPGCKFPDIRYLVVLLSTMDKCAPDASKSLALFSPFLRYYYSGHKQHTIYLISLMSEENVSISPTPWKTISYTISQPTLVRCNQVFSLSLQIRSSFIYDWSTQQQISLRQNAMPNLVTPTSSSKRKESGIPRTSLEVLLSPLRLLPNPPEHSL